MTKSMWMAEDSSYSYGLFPWFSAVIEMVSFSPWGVEHLLPCMAT